MSVNRHQPHVLVLPEDDANRQLANGFVLEEALSNRKIQILEEAGGWLKVLNSFREDHVGGLERYPHRFMVLLIDFDGAEKRLSEARTFIPAHLSERVFVLGVRTEPEDLRRLLGPYETIGLALAKDCIDGTDFAWDHELLRHNSVELERLREKVRPILFQ